MLRLEQKLREKRTLVILHGHFDFAISAVSRAQLTRTFRIDRPRLAHEFERARRHRSEASADSRKNFSASCDVGGAEK